MVNEKPATSETLAEGYRRRAARDMLLAVKFEGVSAEASEELGVSPTGDES